MKKLALQAVIIFCGVFEISSLVQVQQVGKERNDLGEGPHWDERNGVLYLVDIERPSILRYEPGSFPGGGKYYRASVPGVEYIGFIIPVEGHDDLFVVGADLKFLLIRWNGRAKVATIVKVLTDVDLPSTHRLNDGKADPRGRVLGGTMLASAGESDADGAAQSFDDVLVSMSADLAQRTMLSDIGLSNGLAWNRARGKMYYVDSMKYTVTEYDYDEATGSMSNPRVILNTTDGRHKLPQPSLPDGMTIDTKGILYVALFNGSRVLQVDPTTQQITREIMIPTKQVTSLAWGGPHLEKLYVTTGSKTWYEGQVNSDPNAGRVYVILGLGARGRPASRAVLDEEALVKRRFVRRVGGRGDWY